MRNVSDKSHRENQNTHFMFSNFFLEIIAGMKYGRGGQATGDNMGHSYCMLGD
jgi:hypothetical protein